MLARTDGAQHVTASNLDSPALTISTTSLTRTRSDLCSAGRLSELASDAVPGLELKTSCPQHPAGIYSWCAVGPWARRGTWARDGLCVTDSAAVMLEYLGIPAGLRYVGTQELMYTYINQLRIHTAVCVCDDSCCTSDVYAHIK